MTLKKLLPKSRNDHGKKNEFQNYVSETTLNHISRYEPKELLGLYSIDQEN